MADSKKIKNITVGGNTYILGSGGGGDGCSSVPTTKSKLLTKGFLRIIL